MCLYPRLFYNKKYRATKKNGGFIPTIRDERVKFITAACGHCIECREQKARAWTLRLSEELKVSNYSYFVTLTYSDESLKLLAEKAGKDEINTVASFSVRRFLERYRKKYKKSLKHFLIPEMGQESSERIHLHGIIFSNKELSLEELSKFWKYGRADIGEYCNLRTINYIVKYITKVDIKHKYFNPKILCSPGLGKDFMKQYNIKQTYKYEKGKTREYALLKNGAKINLPIYYRNKLYTEEEREKMWIDRLNKKTVFIRGIKQELKTQQDYLNYFKLLAEQQAENERLGFGNDGKEWKRTEYKTQLDTMNGSRVNIQDKNDICKSNPKKSAEKA